MTAPDLREAPEQTFRRALESIAASSCCGDCQEAKRVALAALASQRDSRPSSVDSVESNSRSPEAVGVDRDDAIISASSKYVAPYRGDPRGDVVTDVLNAFYAGARWERRFTETQRSSNANGSDEKETKGVAHERE